MILSQSKWSHLKEVAAEVVVVGSGAAGISLALELESLGRSVVLLEAGEEQYTPDSQELYSGDSVGIPLPYGLMGSRLRFLGGSTNCWGGGCGELDEIDFIQRDWVEFSGWPILREELTFWYKKATQFLSLDYPSSKPSGFAPNYRAIKGMDTRCLSATPILRFKDDFKDRIERSERITLLTGANCTNLSFVGITGSVSGFVVESYGGVSCKVIGSQYILASGGIENARILLNSYEQTESALPRNDNTGRYFSDHPVAPSATVLGYHDSVDRLGVASVFDRSQARNLNFPYFTVPFRVQEKERILNGAVQFGRVGVENHPSVNAAWRLMNAYKGNSSNFEYDDVKKVVSNPVRVFQAAMNRRSGSGTTRMAMRFQIEQSPNPESTISLSIDRDRFGLRKVKLDWNFTDLERRTVDVINFYVSKNLATEDQGILKLDRGLLSDRNKLPEDLRGGQHHSGATRMAATKDAGVVDSNLKVFEAENLYITGSSVFPTNGWVNPTLSIIAISIRLANHLDKKLS